MSSRWTLVGVLAVSAVGCMASRHGEWNRNTCTQVVHFEDAPILADAPPQSTPQVAEQPEDPPLLAQPTPPRSANIPPYYPPNPLKPDSQTLTPLPMEPPPAITLSPPRVAPNPAPAPASPLLPLPVVRNVTRKQEPPRETNRPAPRTDILPPLVPSEKKAGGSIPLPFPEEEPPLADAPPAAGPTQLLPPVLPK